MNDPLQELLNAGALDTSSFPPNSRYHGVQVTHYTDASGETVTHLRRRLIPQADKFATIQEHTVAEGDRVDNLANQYMGDPTLFWRICDANNAHRPDELTEQPGRNLVITLPEGVPGISNG